MAQSVYLMGATYQDVPSVVLPTDNQGGTASFYDARTVTYNLSGGATVSANPTNAIAGQGFSLKLKAPAGYNLNGVTITMGGVDITSQVFTPDEAGGGGGGGVTITDEANATGTTCVITTGGSPTPTPSIPLNTELIDFTKIVNGYVIGNDGTVTENQWSCHSDYTLIDPSMTFSYIGYSWYYINFYTESKTFISSIYMHSDAESIVNDYAHGTLNSSKIPSTAAYLIINTNPNNPTSSTMSLIRTA